MRKRQWAVAGLAASSATAVLVALMTSTASAALPPPGSLGTLTLQPATGTDATAPAVVTSQGCTPDSDSYIAHVFGPGGFEPGLVATFGLQDVNFSSTQSFPVQFTKGMADIARDNLTSVVAGKYVIRVSCMVAFSQTATGAFTTNLYFTDPAHYQVNDPSGPPPPSSTTTSPTVSTSRPASTTSPAPTTVTTVTTTSSTTPTTTSTSGTGTTTTTPSTSGTTRTTTSTTPTSGTSTSSSTPAGTSTSTSTSTPTSSRSTTTAPPSSTSTTTTTSKPPTSTSTSTTASTTTTRTSTPETSSSTTTTGTSSSTGSPTIPAGTSGGGSGTENVVGTTVRTNLANTGVNVGLTALTGAALMGFGAVAVVATRRRKPAPPQSWPSE